MFGNFRFELILDYWLSEMFALGGLAGALFFKTGSSYCVKLSSSSSSNIDTSFLTAALFSFSISILVSGSSSSLKSSFLNSSLQSCSGGGWYVGISLMLLYLGEAFFSSSGFY